MIKKFIISLSLLITFCSASAKSALITLTPENTVSFNSEVSAESVQTAIVAIENNPSKVIYLYINSPGGDVIAGIGMVTFLQHTQKNVVCIASYAASMAHAILEACPYRVGTPSNILLQHKPSTVARGSPSEIKGQLEVLEGLELYLAKMEAKRIGISVEEFRKRTFNPWITFGEQSLKERLLDTIAPVTCQENMNKKYNGCPIQEPVAVPTTNILILPTTFTTYQRNFYGNL